MLAEIILAAITLFLFWQIIKKPSNYPPGPWGVPLIGSIPLNLANFEKRLLELRKEHGNIISWRIGTKLLVFIFDYKLAKEAFGGMNFVDRPDSNILSLLEGDEKLGISSTNGVHWHNIRRFSLRHLRDLGMGKSRLVSAVQHEAMSLVSEMKKQAGKPAPLPYELTPAVLNVVWQMVASKRFDLDNAEIRMFDELISDMQSNMTPLVTEELFPWVKLIPEFVTKPFTKTYILSELNVKMRKFLQVFIDDHIKNLDRENPQDYIDAYLVEMENQKSDPESTMSIEDLIFCIADLFGAGTETTTTTLQWAMFYLAYFPKIQRRLQEEVDHVLQGESLATLEDKPKLSYTEAFIQEVLRYSSFASIGGLHCASNDVQFSGYKIPKGAVVMIASATIHFNSEYYDSPEEFRPERFLDSNGKIANVKEGFLPFGIGRRQCLGEALARMEILIFLTTLVKHLNFGIPPGNAFDINPEENPMFHAPKVNQDLLITVRSK